MPDHEISSPTLQTQSSLLIPGTSLNLNFCADSKHFGHLLQEQGISCCVVSQPEQREIFKVPWEHEALFWSKLFFSPSILIRRKGINASLRLLCVRLYTSSKFKKKIGLSHSPCSQATYSLPAETRHLNQQLEFSVESADGGEHWIL